MQTPDTGELEGLPQTPPFGLERLLLACWVAQRPLRDRSEDGQKRSEEARRRLEDSVYSVHKAEQGEKGAQSDSLCFVKRV